MQAPPSMPSTAADRTSQASASGAAGADDGWAAFMDAATVPLPATSTQHHALEDHWDAFQVGFL